MTKDSTQEPACKCTPLNKDLMYTGNCTIHQIQPTITIESLKRSSNPEAKALLALLDQSRLSLLEEVLKGQRTVIEGRWIIPETNTPMWDRFGSERVIPVDHITALLTNKEGK